MKNGGLYTVLQTEQFNSLISYPSLEHYCCFMLTLS